MALTIHHLQNSQSERLPWLCEELNLPYSLILHQRAPLFSPESIKSLSPIGQAPIIHDALVSPPITLFESAACAEYIAQVHGGGRLVLHPEHADYAQYLYWFHFSNGTLQPNVVTQMQLGRAPGVAESDYGKAVKKRFDDLLGYVDRRLREHEWLAGSEFTLADIMSVFSFTTMRTFYGFDLTGYDGILGWLKRTSEREAFQNARAKADPDLELMIDAKPPRSFVQRQQEAGKM